MDLAIRITLSLFCVPLVVQGMRLILTPTAMLSLLGIHPHGSVGLNTIRGILGAAFLGNGVWGSETRSPQVMRRFCIRG